ncbi:MAG: PHP-associated domain-containing protein [Clostridia bacterium]
MSKNLYEIHCHTRESSPCSIVRATAVADLHHMNGYTGICVTDHYYAGFFERHHGRDAGFIVDRFLEGYDRARERGLEIGLHVLLGMELRFLENNNDYLVYGFDRSFLHEDPFLYKRSLAEFRRIIRGTGIIAIQAHPFRSHMTRVDPRLLDGMETYNGNARHDSRNHLAKRYARLHGLAMTCSGDFHRPEDIGTAMMDFHDVPEDEKALARMVMAGKYRMQTKERRNEA